MVPTQCIVLPRSLFLAETATLSPFSRFVVSTLLIHVRNLGIRMASQAGLAKVPFTERFVHAYIAHARGVIDVSHFFCDADGKQAEKALRIINEDPISHAWCCISFKVTFAGHLDVLNADELRTFHETFDEALIATATHEEYPAEIIYSALAERANLLIAAWKVYESHFTRAPAMEG